MISNLNGKASEEERLALIIGPIPSPHGAQVNQSLHILGRWVERGGLLLFSSCQKTRDFVASSLEKAAVVLRHRAEGFGYAVGI